MLTSDICYHRLAVYVYEYLHHLGAHNAAQAFLAEVSSASYEFKRL